MVMPDGGRAGGEAPGQGRSGEEAPGQVACELLMALDEGRLGDALARADPRVTWVPVTRPGLSVYQGHDGIVRLASDALAVYGPHRLEIKDAAVSVGAQPSEDGKAKVVVRLRVIQETGEGEVPGPPIAVEFTIRDGLAVFIDSRYEA